MADQAERVILEAEDQVTSGRGQGQRRAGQLRETSGIVARQGHPHFGSDPVQRPAPHRLARKAGRDLRQERRGPADHAAGSTVAAIQPRAAGHRRDHPVLRKDDRRRRRRPRAKLSPSRRPRKPRKRCGSSPNPSSRSASASASSWRIRSRERRARSASVLTALGPFGIARRGGRGRAWHHRGCRHSRRRRVSGEYGTRVKDAELRTGLTAKEVGQFGFAARAVGQDISIVERLMRGLSQAANDNSSEGEKARATMRGMGIDFHTATGEMKPTSEILIEISEGLNRLPEGLQRDAAAMDLFKKVGIEAIPFMTELNENLRVAHEQGFGPTEEDIRRFYGIPARSDGARNQVGRAGPQVQGRAGRHRDLGREGRRLVPRTTSAPPVTRNGSTAKRSRRFRMPRRSGRWAVTARACRSAPIARKWPTWSARRRRS